MRIILTAALIALSSCAEPAFAAREIVTAVKDGDTFEIAGHKTFGLASSIRVLGIDTPESHMPPARCPAERELGIKAADYANELVRRSSGQIWTSGTVHRDKWNGRYLFRVILKIGGAKIDWGNEMIRAGFARAYVYKTDDTGKRSLTKPDWCMILGDVAAPLNLLPPIFETEK